ncbi:MAG: glycosyltransferase [Prolixibacteraceae bacterium]|nr:glycosyltransferase [Prolixibacteraceae bacterium]
MKIVIIGTAYPFRGGLAAFNERLAREFIKEGHSVRLETFTLQYPGFLFPGKTQFADWEKPADLEITRSVNSINPLSWIRVGRKLKKEKPDLVIFKFWLPFMAPCFGTIARFIRKNKHTRIVSIADNIIPHEKRIGDRSLTSYFMNAIDGMVPMSKSVKEDIKIFRKDLPVKLCPHPVFDNFGESINREEALEKLELESDFIYFLFFGFIRDYKGLDWLLEAFSEERLREFPVKLIVAGEFYSDPSPYLDLIDNLDIADLIILKTEFIPDDDVKIYFSAADLVVQPYKSATQSGVTQIGYQFDKPMLVTKVGGLPEIIPDQVIGYVVEPKPKAIANALYDFLKNKRKQEFTENVKKEKQKFLWSSMVSAILEVWNKTVNDDNQK